MPQDIILSFCIPIYNESAILERQLKKIETGLSELIGKDSFEILISDNGSTDNTSQILEKLKSKTLKKFQITKRGHGGAYRECIKNARGKWIMLSAIDLPFGFDDLKEALKISDNYDIIFGSKRHPLSEVTVPITRKAASLFYSLLLMLFFQNKVRDTQGTILVRNTAIKRILSKCTAPNAFFTAQIAIYAKRGNLKIAEIPVRYNSKKNVRKSKYNIIKDGGQMLSSVLKEYYLLHKSS